jgi:hypothetical protein
MSAIVLRNGDVLRNPWTDSHEDLVRLFKLVDKKEGAFARVEFRPAEVTDLATPGKYTLRIDEERMSPWFDADMQERVANQMRGWVKTMIIDGDVDLICGGAFILAAKAKVSTVKNCLIHVMLGSSSVGEMLGSSSVGEMRGSSSVGEMWGSSSVGVMWESSSVGVMRESSKVSTDNRNKK